VYQFSPFNNQCLVTLSEVRLLLVPMDSVAAAGDPPGYPVRCCRPEGNGERKRKA
jgi:hypothetical protein